MKRSQLAVSLVLLALLFVAGFAARGPGAVPLYGWIAALALAVVAAAGLVVRDTAVRRARAAVPAAPGASKTGGIRPATSFGGDDGLDYPHPIINPLLCIGCHACIEACPHGVIDMVDGIATPVNPEQCMEDTACQVECPTVPKACIVVNTTKVIPERKVPKRDRKFMTNVPGVYLVGDVSGVPLIKNAINEGAAVATTIAKELESEGGERSDGEYDVAIIGVGPAGLSAAATANFQGLTYVAIEQDRMAATIQQYPAGKYVFFKPDMVEARGGIPLKGDGLVKEFLLASWAYSLNIRNIVVNEYETCKRIERDGERFRIETEREREGGRREYRARRVVVSVGTRGTPRRLGVPGEDIRIASGESGGEGEEKVKYRLTDPNAYSGKHCIVVGAGNSALEAAIDLAAIRSEDGTEIIGWRENVVSLVVRSDFRGDVKLGNKMLVYDCIDAGKITLYSGQTVKEIEAGEISLMRASERDPKKAKESARVRNDFVFALIGSDRPTSFLKSIGIDTG